MSHEIYGVIPHDTSRRTDYLYRVSLKCLICNDKGHVLVVKERGRSYWDLPGGGMDHGENIKTSIAREMKEEVNLEGDFAYRILAVEEAALLNHGFWQIRLIFEIKPHNMSFTPGDDGDEVEFRDPTAFEYSELPVERRILEYSDLAIA